MFFYKIQIAYDGTRFKGWQSQNHVATISNTMENSFRSIFNQEVSILGASRTDSGVHALCQFASVKTGFFLESDRLMNAWNNNLPDDIVIRSLEICDKEFNPFKNVLEKIYFYDFSLERPLPFNNRYVLYYYWAIDIAKLETCLKLFIGQHDFQSYTTDCREKNTVRTINDISLIYIPELKIYRITVIGKSFLHHMIRRIVGACLYVASKPELEPAYLIKILEEKNPNQALPNAPAKGLMLYKITYL